MTVPYNEVSIEELDLIHKNLLIPGVGLVTNLDSNLNLLVVEQNTDSEWLQMLLLYVLAYNVIYLPPQPHLMGSDISDYRTSMATGMDQLIFPTKCRDI